MAKRTRQKIAEENLIVHFECKLKQIHIKLLKIAMSFFASCQKMKVVARHGNAKNMKGSYNTLIRTVNKLFYPNSASNLGK